MAAEVPPLPSSRNIINALSTVAFLARRLRNETGYDRYLGPPADRPASAVTVHRAR
ncbi:hypothetical protein ThrDRAFT_04262 [Frankia casuarinae]|uniref:hypothetical protein n=1 Tax=Frankia sp. CgS1 TaxID=1745381 RepID=UPI0002DA1678|nr:hypothetical protein [Frankia sp. CgIS1]ETA00277.1 hypothetical protein CcI6DRAFT_04281 [Frankia sp. CcI6]EYT90129.1 hypothetical protein ThrDRAFT_04262 [Frankia casuarinae]KDA41043.1 hypothetical protein BMG523Draft_04125 [Frankia sp. BMG5.23]KEZ34559.1 hypothetical protein CEDDRAFT_04101 [Frankia sp. CeD]KFB02780.1 hypothetical protein ALLO2DRAFT_04459 [Frankia sp. Allo2]